MPETHVTDIRTERRGSRVRIIVIDDDPWRTTSAATVGAVGIAVGDTVDLDELSTTIDAAERGCARTRAVALLHYRDRSRAELRDKLVADGYPTQLASSLVEDFVRLSLVDDERLAENLARSLATGRSYGRTRVLRELARRGIPEDLALRHTDVATADETVRLVALATRYAPAARGSADRLAARLIRRGFAPRDVFPAAREAVERLAEDDDRPSDES